jgi:soluble lytic murein transglycosylase-like protein
MNNSSRYDELFKNSGLKSGIDWRLLKAQVRQESNFNPDAVNKVSGAKGLAQFMDKTWREWCDLSPGIQQLKDNYDPFNPAQSISAQSAYMSFLVKIIDQKLTQVSADKTYLMHWALASYNWGIGNILGRMVKDKMRRGVMQFSEFDYPKAEKYLPPETSNYVRQIMIYYKEYQQEKNLT